MIEVFDQRESLCLKEGVDLTCICLSLLNFLERVSLFVSGLRVSLIYYILFARSRHDLTSSDSFVDEILGLLEVDLNCMESNILKDAQQFYVSAGLSSFLVSSLEFDFIVRDPVNVVPEALRKLVELVVTIFFVCDVSRVLKL